MVAGLIWLTERRLLMSLILLLVLPVSIFGAIKAWHSTTNDVTDWMPDQFQATNDLEEFIRYFHSDELMMISWDHQTVDDQRAIDFSDRLTVSAAGDENQPQLFRGVWTAHKMIEMFSRPPFQLDEEEALQRTRGWLTDGTGKECGVLAFVSPAGAANRHAAVNRILACADEVTGLSRERLRIAGPSIESVAIDAASQDGLFVINLLSFAICILVLVTSLKSLRAAWLVFSLALFNEQLCLAIIWYSGGQMDSVLLLAANLTLVLSVSIGIHLINYYRDAQKDHPLTEAPTLALQRAFRPTFFAMLTTAIGLGALAVSSLRPIAKFGTYASISVVVAAFVMMIYIPVHFRIWPLAWKTAPDAPSWKASSVADGWRVRSAAWIISGVAIVLIVVGTFGVQRLSTALGLNQLLASDAKILKDYQWMEQHIGPLIPVEMVLTLPGVTSSDKPDADQAVDSDLVSKQRAQDLFDQYKLVAAIEDSIGKQLPEVQTISAINFGGVPPNVGNGFRQRAQLIGFRRGLSQCEEKLIELGFLTNEETSRKWRLSVRTSLFRNDGYDRLMSKLAQIVSDVSEEFLANHKITDKPELLIAGGVPLVHQAQQKVLDDLLKSFSLAFGLVAVALTFVFRSVFQAVLVMIPNTFPVAIVFGTMGWLGWPAEVGTVLTASAALGIAVDDSLHFLTWYQKARLAGESPAASGPSIFSSLCGADASDHVGLWFRARRFRFK